VSLYERALATGLVDAGVYNDLAVFYDRQGVKRSEACELLSKAFALAPENQSIRNNYLASLARRIAPLVSDRRWREALPLLQERAAIEPKSARSQYDAGLCLAQLGELQSALQCFTRAIDLDPDEASYYNDFGLACYELGLFAEARGAFQQVLNLKPESVPAHVHLGLLANVTGLSAIAVNMLRRALAIDPECADAHSNLAALLREQGFQRECRTHFQRAMELRPDSTLVFSNYLLSLNGDPWADPAWIAAEHMKFQSLIRGEVRRPVVRDADPSRRLRIGYLSPDFRQHSVAHFILPVMEGHDRAKVEVIGYSASNREDAMTSLIRGACDHWRGVFRMADEELAALIAQDGIDVLVELSGHTSNNRLTLLARRAAPVQMTYLGYPNTTGLVEVDYRITDAIADPPGLTESWHSEKLVRIEGGFLAYRAPDWARELPVVALPADDVGHITFGSFNNLAKINEVVLESWASIMEGVPGSVLLLKAKGLKDDRVQARIRDVFRARGLDADERVVMLGLEHSSVEHLGLYNRVDLALDTFPYNGTTTTCEALWMGTPVLTLMGRNHAGRVGASLLARIGLDDLVCENREAYVEQAMTLARERSKLKVLRTGLRERLVSSPLMDGRRVANELESAFARVWRDFCQGAGGTSAVRTH
jgi:protein O-GlcNAc transferase